jgi:hypothetical protein
MSVGKIGKLVVVGVLVIAFGMSEGDGDGSWVGKVTGIRVFATGAKMGA